MIYTADSANEDPGDNIEVYYGVKANTSMPAGIYSGTIVYTAVINGAAQDLASVSPSRLNGLNGGQTLTISTSLNAAASGVGTITVNVGEYSCTNPTASNAGDGSVVITCIAPANDSGTYDVSVDIAGYSKTYYIANAIEYFKEYAPTLTDLTYMHEMTSAVCDATTTPSKTVTTVPEKVLIDVRGKDGTGTLANPASGTNQQTYLVRKLADGNCWMVQNLNMNLSTGVTLDSTTTDLGNETAGRTFTPQYNTQTAAGTAWAQDGSDGARSFEPGEAMYFDGGVGTGTLDTATYNYAGYLSSGADYWHVGNYYNWYAATAGTGLSTTANNNAETNVADSICPKNWKLPDNTGTKSFQNLLFTTYGLSDNNAASSNTILAAPLNFVRSGYYGWSEAGVRGRGYGGIWWSSAAYTALNAHYLDTNSSRVIPQHGNYKGYGLSVRCVAR